MSCLLTTHLDSGAYRLGERGCREGETRLHCRVDPCNCLSVLAMQVEIVIQGTKKQIMADTYLIYKNLDGARAAIQVNPSLIAELKRSVNLAAFGGAFFFFFALDRS